MQASAKATLASLVQEHISSLVSEAACIQRHAKRARYREKEGQLRQRIHADDINLALQWRGSEKLYATSVVGPGDDNPSTKRIDLNEYLKTENQLRPPSELGLTSHWLAVDGVQPEIPQNPTTSTITGGVAVHRLSQEEEMGSDGSPISIRQLLPRLLTEELQLYFSRVTIAVEREAGAQQDAAIAHVARDPGLQELVPFFCRYISTQLYQHIGNVEQSRTLIRLARSLLMNPYLHLELQLHQLLPPLITCAVAKTLSSHPFDNHWALRQEAGQVLLQACNLFGQEYATLKSRVMKTLCEAVAASKPLSTQFGGIAALTLFGPKTVDAFLLPLIIPYYDHWETALGSCPPLPQQVELQHCQQAMLDALAVFLQHALLEEQVARISYEDLEEAMGEKLIVAQNAPTDYAQCVL